jgi:hypothetical protein
MVIAATANTMEKAVDGDWGSSRLRETIRFVALVRFTAIARNFSSPLSLSCRPRLHMGLLDSVLGGTGTRGGMSPMTVAFWACWPIAPSREKVVSLT